MKKTISRPIIGGAIFAALSYLSTAANLTIQLSGDLILGPWELFNVLSAALFGPIGLLVTELGLDISGYFYLIKGVYPAPQDLYFMIGNYAAHIAALAVVAAGYRVFHEQMKMPRLLAGWILLMGIYYLMGVTLSVLFHNIAVPALGATLAGYVGTVRLEFVFVAGITSLILLALPERYRRPQWVETEKTFG